MRKLRISIAFKYFNRYKLCVTAPDNSRDCDTFNIHKQGSSFGDSVRWSRHFPNGGSGPYSVKWKGT
ncbi:MAG TPA: hypothetical protein VEV82_03140, partial [Actinomycetota bacterium]|nr:hypothetical protein [Actinomycetota bacterium]